MRCSVIKTVDTQHSLSKPRVQQDVGDTRRCIAKLSDFKAECPRSSSLPPTWSSGNTAGLKKFEAEHTIYGEPSHRSRAREVCAQRLPNSSCACDSAEGVDASDLTAVEGLCSGRGNLFCSAGEREGRWIRGRKMVRRIGMHVRRALSENHEMCKGRPALCPADSPVNLAREYVVEWKSKVKRNALVSRGERRIL